MALVLSGGGSKGAYEAGVLHGLAHSLPKEEVAYDVISGVSVGSINAAFVSLFEKGDEVKMSEELVEMYMNMTTDEIWKEWPYGIFRSIWKEPSLLDNSPLENFLGEIIEAKGPLKRSFIVSTVDS